MFICGGGVVLFIFSFFKPYIGFGLFAFRVKRTVAAVLIIFPLFFYICVSQAVKQEGLGKYWIRGSLTVY